MAGLYALVGALGFVPGFAGEGARKKGTRIAGSAAQCDEVLAKLRADR